MPIDVPPVERCGPLRIRRWGSSGPAVLVLHGGPAASGSAAPIARGLADGFRAIEPWQRGSAAEPLTVARHVADLHELVAALGERPAVVGESWGAMLALAYGAAHPDEAGPLVLVGCGTFDLAARARFKALIDKRVGEEGRARLARIEAKAADPGERLQRRYEVIGPVYDYDPLPDEDLGPGEPFDGQAHHETWDDMLRCQAEGLYPAAFARIAAPVLMLHGDWDPHPGRMIRDGLLRLVPHLEYVELPRCGHRPWAERHARAPFFAALRAWLVLQSAA